MPPRPFVPRQAKSRPAAAAAAADTAPAERKEEEEEEQPPKRTPTPTASQTGTEQQQQDNSDSSSSSPLTTEEAEQLAKLLRKVSRVGLPDEKQQKKKEDESDRNSVAEHEEGDGNEKEVSSSKKEVLSAAPAAARSVIRALRQVGLVSGEPAPEDDSSSSSSSEDNDNDDDNRASSSSEKQNIPVPAAKKKKQVPTPSPPVDHQHHHHNEKMPQDKAAVKQLFGHTRHISHFRRSEAQLADANTKSTVEAVTSILDALGGVLQCRFVSLLVPDELKQRELRCVAYGGLDCATRTMDSFSSYAHGSANLLVAAASLALHHNVVINVRLPGSGGDSDEDDEIRKGHGGRHHPAATRGGGRSPPVPSSQQQQQQQQSSGTGGASRTNTTYSPVSCALSVPIPGPNNYAVAVLHVMDRSFGVESFSQEDESVVWCYARLLSRVVGAFDAKRRSAPDRAIQRALQTVLRSVESVDGAKIRKVLEGDFTDINIGRETDSKGSGGGRSWGDETMRAPPVFRTQSGRVAQLVRKLQDGNVLFTTKASDGRGRTVECEYHAPLALSTEQHQQQEGNEICTKMIEDLLSLCTLVDHTHRVADAWYRTAALLAESRAEVQSLKTDVKRLTQEVNAGKLKVDLQRALLMSGRGAGGGGASSSSNNAGGSPAAERLGFTAAERASIMNMGPSADRGVLAMMHPPPLPPPSSASRTSAGGFNDTLSSQTGGVASPTSVLFGMSAKEEDEEE